MRHERQDVVLQVLRVAVVLHHVHVGHHQHLDHEVLAGTLATVPARTVPSGGGVGRFRFDAVVGDLSLASRAAGLRHVFRQTI